MACTVSLDPYLVQGTRKMLVHSTTEM